MALYKGSTKICPIITKGITPTGTINITENGTVDVTNYASANISVSGSGGFLYTTFEAIGATFNIDLSTGTIESNGDVIPVLICNYSNDYMDETDWDLVPCILDDFVERCMDVGADGGAVVLYNFSTGIPLYLGSYDSGYHPVTSYR